MYYCIPRKQHCKEPLYYYYYASELSLFIMDYSITGRASMQLNFVKALPRFISHTHMILPSISTSKSSYVFCTASLWVILLITVHANVILHLRLYCFVTCPRVDWKMEKFVIRVRVFFVIGAALTSKVCSSISLSNIFLCKKLNGFVLFCTVFCKVYGGVEKRYFI